MKSRMRAVAAGLLLAAAGCRQAGAQDGLPVERSFRVDWPRALLAIEVSRALDPAIPNVSKARAQAEEEIRLQLPGMAQEALAALPLDSSRTVGEALERGEPGDPDVLHVFPGRLLGSSLSPDLRRVRVRCELPLYGTDGLLTPFITHTRASPVRRVLGFTPARAFSGVVIDARGLNPPLRPAVAIRLFDPQLRPVLEPLMSRPESARAWGMAAYTDRYGADPAAAEEPFRGRIGELPLRTLARAVFGKNGTDLVLADEAARALLGRKENRALLEEGRVLIILDPQP